MKDKVRGYMGACVRRVGGPVQVREASHVGSRGQLYVYVCFPKILPENNFLFAGIT